jgi:thioredoxin-like negative regulator of GroEL
MIALRYLTLAWPGLPWLWLRGSLAGLVLALAFAVSFDVAMVTTFIWGDLIELPFTVAVWTATAVVWLVSTVSAVATFPHPLAQPPAAEVDPLFARARDAYLARDWLAAETRLRELLLLAPTDGEAQLLLGTLLRRVGRLEEARAALEKLAGSDSGARWQRAIAADLSRLATGSRGAAADSEPVSLPLADQASTSRAATGTRAAA